MTESLETASKSPLNPSAIQNNDKHLTSVLVIEDNPTQANLLRIGLNRRGFSVQCVAHLYKAINALKQTVYDVILMDLNLPDSEGLKTFYEVFAHSTGTPIVVLTSMNDQDLASEAINAGAQDYLIKGVPSDESVVRCLKYAVQRQKFETQLWETERRNRLILENSNDAFFAITQEGRIVEWNKRAEQLFGFYKNDALSQYLPELVMTPQGGTQLILDLEKFANGNRDTLVNNTVELEFVRDTGEAFQAAVTIFPLSSSTGYQFCAFVRALPSSSAAATRLSSLFEPHHQEQHQPSLFAVSNSGYAVNAGMISELSNNGCNATDRRVKEHVQALTRYIAEIGNLTESLPPDSQRLLSKINIELGLIRDLVNDHHLMNSSSRGARPIETF